MLSLKHTQKVFLSFHYLFSFLHPNLTITTTYYLKKYMSHIYLFIDEINELTIGRTDQEKKSFTSTLYSNNIILY